MLKKETEEFPIIYKIAREKGLFLKPQVYLRGPSSDDLMALKRGSSRLFFLPSATRSQAAATPCPNLLSRLYFSLWQPPIFPVLV